MATVTIRRKKVMPAQKSQEFQAQTITGVISSGQTTRGQRLKDMGTKTGSDGSKKIGKTT